MRITVIRLKVNLHHQFKSCWLIKRKRKIFQTQAEAVLCSKGIKIIDAKDLLRPAVIEETYELPSHDSPVLEEKPPCYIFKNTFKPLEDIEQCQLITNSLVFDSLPENILNKVEEPSVEDEEIMRDAILNSHLLDAKQSKLPHVLDVINLPGYKPPRKYGIRIEKKISSLLYQLLLHAEQSHLKAEPKRILEDVSSRVTLMHSGKLMHMCHEAALLLCTKTPLEPVAGPEEVQAKVGAPMPDIYPLSPLIHCKAQKHYDLNDGYALPGAALAPHTVFVGFLNYKFLLRPKQFYGMTLLQAFSHAASYARECNKDLAGDLKEPVTLNIVHTNGQYFHIGRFQLNTLDCNGSTRNFFWHDPWTIMYKTIGFENARPFLSDLNASPIALLRAIY